MKVDVDESLFADFTNSSMLASVVRLGWEERHRVFVRANGSAAYESWLDAHPKATREEWELVEDLSFRKEALEPSALAVRLIAAPLSNWALPIPELTLPDGLSLLQAQFELIVENGRNDRAFLLRLASPVQRGKVLDREAKDWLRFSGAGGIGEMKALLETQRYQRPKARFLTFVAHDSDAMQPNSPSIQAQAVATACAATSITHHMLGRRAIENYLPLPSLEAWARKRPKERLRAYRAYARMTDAQRSHYNLKGGFSADLHRSAEAGALFTGLAGPVIRALDAGFGGNIAELYRDDDAVCDEHADTSRHEVQQFVATLLGLLN